MLIADVRVQSAASHVKRKPPSHRAATTPQRVGYITFTGAVKEYVQLMFG